MRRAKSGAEVMRQRARPAAPDGDRGGCCVAGCLDSRLVAVAGDQSTTMLMCVPHATSWTQTHAPWRVLQPDGTLSRVTFATWLRVVFG